MSAHTPGPWTVDPKCSTRVIAAGDVGVAACGGYFTNQRDSGELLAGQEADARLIAAAPELLAALKQLTNELNVVACSGRSRPVDWFERRVIRLRAVIAKAEGKP